MHAERAPLGASFVFIRLMRCSTKPSLPTHYACILPDEIEMCTLMSSYSLRTGAISPREYVHQWMCSSVNVFISHISKHFTTLWIWHRRFHSVLWRFPGVAVDLVRRLTSPPFHYHKETALKLIPSLENLFKPPLPAIRTTPMFPLCLARSL